jgi:hypothetical protein
MKEPSLGEFHAPASEFSWMDWKVGRKNFDQVSGHDYPACAQV